MVSIRRSDGFHMVSQDQAGRPGESQQVCSVVVEATRDAEVGPLAERTKGRRVAGKEDRGACVTPTLPRLIGFGTAGE